jgi:hypothetical protein
MRRFLIVLVVLGFSLAACGGGSDTGTPATSLPSVNTGSGGPIDIAKCTDAAKAMGAAAAAVPQAITGTGTDLSTSVDQLEAFADAAPDEIKDDLKTVAEGYANIIKVFKDSGFDPTSGQPPSAAVLARLVAASGALGDASFQQALQRVGAWFKDNCGGG